MSELGSSEVSSSEVREVENSTEVSEKDLDKDFNKELDETYSKSVGDKKMEDFEERDVASPAETEKTFDNSDNLDSELDKKYKESVEEDTEKNDINEAERNNLTEKEKALLKKETGWSDEIINSTRSLEEAEIYKNANLKESEANGKKCLIRQDLNLEQKDEFGQTNRERMKNGKPPLTESGGKIELHHIGQHQDSPLAELTMQEHRGKGIDAVLHDKNIDSEIDRSSFATERKHHWEDRSQT